VQNVVVDQREEVGEELGHARFDVDPRGDLGLGRVHQNVVPYVGVERLDRVPRQHRHALVDLGEEGEESCFRTDGTGRKRDLQQRDPPIMPKYGTKRIN
jgi:hypothetical protein